MTRDNDTWLTHLTAGGALQGAALTDLRYALLRGLRQGLSTRIDDSVLEDAVQDALVRILERLPQFQGRSRFLTWATAIAIRVALSELRRRRWKDVSLDELTGDAAILEAGFTERSPGAELEQKSIVRRMYEVIRDQLTERQRKALLAELRGMPQEEIARSFGTNRNAIYKLTHDARKRLKRGLEAAGYRAEDIRTAFAE